MNDLPTTHSPIAASGTSSDRAERSLRLALTANAAFSTLTGVVSIVAAPWVADRLGAEDTWTTWLIRAIGIGLLAFAAGVAVVARSPVSVLRPWSLEITLADFGWVAGTIAVLLFVELPPAGVALLAGAGAVVLILGVTQAIARRAMLRASRASAQVSAVASSAHAV